MRKLVTVAELPTFSRQAERLLTEAQKEALLGHLAANPQDGDVIEGTGGVRKLRFAAQGRGKSGGVRVIYYYHDDTVPLLALLLYGKNEQADLSAEQRKTVAGMVRELKDNLQRRRTGQ